MIRARRPNATVQGVRHKRREAPHRGQRLRRRPNSHLWSITRLDHPCDLASIVRPESITAYFDRLQVWLERPLTRQQLQLLRKLCGGKLHSRAKRARFGRWGHSYCQVLVLRRPSGLALELLRRHGGVMINMLECSLDWIFDEEESKDSACNLVGQLHVKKWRHSAHCVIHFGPTRYSGPRKAPNVFVLYADKGARNSREPHCVHLEWRMQRAETLRRAGIRSIDDLLHFDHRAFWKSRLLLYDIDRVKLGRAYHNHRLHSRRKTDWISMCGRYKYHNDLRAGSTLLRALGSTQAIIDQAGRWFSVKQSLIPVDCSALLPLY
jgi:hypothetical protein